MTGALDGVRILELGTAWAGPFATTLCGALGADVIKIESRTRPDFSRRAAGTDDLDGAPNFQDINLGKRSVALDLKTPEARTLALDLAARCDVFMTNLRPGAADRVGLGYEAVRAGRPDVVYVSSSASGSSGAEREYIGFAPTFAALGGMSHLTGWPDGPPSVISMPSDIRSAYATALAILMGLHQREREGRGQYLDLSSIEAIAALTPHAIVEAGLTGRAPGRIGNRSDCFAPQGCYVCREPGSWISICVEDEAQWSVLCRELGRDDWARDARLGDPAGRARRHDELDAGIEAWTSQREAADAAGQLQGAGVPAVPSATPTDLRDDPHLRSRGVFASVEHPVVGARTVLNPPWLLDGEPTTFARPGPRLGEHTEEVLGELLGLEPEHVRQLVERGIAV